MNRTEEKYIEEIQQMPREWRDQQTGVAYVESPEGPVFPTIVPSMGVANMDYLSALRSGIRHLDYAFSDADEFKINFFSDDIYPYFAKDIAERFAARPSDVKGLLMTRGNFPTGYRGHKSLEPFFRDKQTYERFRMLAIARSHDRKYDKLHDEDIQTLGEVINQSFDDYLNIQGHSFCCSPTIEILNKRPETRNLIKPYHRAHTIPAILKYVGNIAYISGYRHNSADEEYKANQEAGRKLFLGD